MSIANSIRIAVQIFAFPVMARLLSPAEYGLAAMAMPIILLVMTLADSGFAQSLVRVDPKNSSEWHSCFWLAFGLGCGFALLLSLASPLIALFLEQPRLREIIPALAAILPLQMLAVVPGPRCSVMDASAELPRLRFSPFLSAFRWRYCAPQMASVSGADFTTNTLLPNKNGRDFFCLRLFATFQVQWHGD